MHGFAPQPTMQLWFTEQEFADAAVAGILLDIPATRQGINDLAKREDWQRYHALVRTEKARGRSGSLTRYHNLHARSPDKLLQKSENHDTASVELPIMVAAQRLRNPSFTNSARAA